MDLKKWKRFKRSGGYRRRVCKQYSELKSEPKFVQTEQVGDNDICGGSVQEDIYCSNTSRDDSEHEFDYKNFVNYENNLQLREDIKIWAIKYNIPHSAYNELSVILNKNDNLIFYYLLLFT